ncbi:hypothetical protein GCM10009560_50390 [Nonomuraea longicatena]|uniref:Uncharacterized protein n=2 Tax=Nonomuraea longicatena TaxID=83682 RepID=A0ABP4ASP2_9ACTN
MFLCPDDHEDWSIQEREQFLTDVNATLRQRGMPEHREPRSVADIDPPLPPERDPCLLGLRLGFYGGEKYRRLADFAQYLAVHGGVPASDASYDPLVEQLYDDLPDRRLAFDHVIAITTCQEIVVLPQPFDEVVHRTDPAADHGILISAHRLRAESTMLGYALRCFDSHTLDVFNDTMLDDLSFAHLDVRIEDDHDVRQAWAGAADLSNRLTILANDVLLSGALAVTG